MWTLRSLIVIGAAILLAYRGHPIVAILLVLAYFC